MMRVVLGLAALAAAVPAAAANLVTNGSFETGDFSGWTQVGDTSFTFVTADLAGGGPTDGSFHGAFGSIDPGGGGVVQSITTVAGQSYTLTFDLAYLGGNPNGYGIFWDGGFDSTEFDVTGFDYTSFSRTLIATSNSTQVGFIFYSDPNFFLLDNISVTEATGAIPEPASWAMLIAGFGLVGAAQRRRRPAAA
jgi:hypothetical protein